MRFFFCLYSRSHTLINPIQYSVLIYKLCAFLNLCSSGKTGRMTKQWDYLLSTRQRTDISLRNVPNIFQIARNACHRYCVMWMCKLALLKRNDICMTTWFIIKFRYIETYNSKTGLTCTCANVIPLFFF